MRGIVGLRARVGRVAAARQRLQRDALAGVTGVYQPSPMGLHVTRQLNSGCVPVVQIRQRDERRRFLTSQIIVVVVKGRGFQRNVRPQAEPRARLVCGQFLRLEITVAADHDRRC